MVRQMWKRWVRQAVAGRPGCDRRFARLNVERCEERAVPSNVANVLVNNRSLDTANGFTQSETSTIVIPNGAGPPIVLVSYNDSASQAIDGQAFTSYARSTDGGVTFGTSDKGTIRAVGGNDDAGDPSLAYDATNDRVYFATLEFANGLSNMQMYRSTDKGATFAAPTNATPGTTTSQDKEWIAVDNFAGAGQGNVYIANRDFGGGDGIYFYKSTNQGATFGPTNGVQIASGAAGNVQGPWVVVEPDHSIDVFYYSSVEPAMFVRRSTNFGASFSAKVKVTDYVSTGTNGNLGLGFRTSVFPQAVANPVNGDLYVAWADLSATGDPDIYFSQSQDHGATWSAKQRVNNDATTNAQWQPSLSVTPDGKHLFMGWYDRRLDPGDSLIDTFGSVANINTATHAVNFNPNFRITSRSFDAVFGVDPQLNPVYMGDYDGSAADANFFYYSWADNRLGEPDVRLARIPTTGPIGPTVFTKNPTGTITSPANAVTLTFSEPMDQTSFNLTDVLSFTGPSYPPYPTNLLPDITGFTWVNSTTLQVNFNPELFRGNYSMVLGPNIKSLATGLKLDENLNGTPGEAADNVTVNFKYDPGKGYTTAPTAISNGPYSVNEGSNITLNGSGNDPQEPASALTYQWDFNGNGIYGETGAAATNGDEVGKNAVFKSAALDGPSSVNINLRVIDTDGLVSPPVTTTINVKNVAPTVVLSSNPNAAAILENTPISYTATATDPSAADTTAGFTYTWTVTKNGGSFPGFSGQGTKTITFNDTDAPAVSDSFVIKCDVKDKDNGVGTASKTLSVSNAKPTGTFFNDSPPGMGKTNPAVVGFAFVNQQDPSPQDQAAGFLYSFDFNNNGSFTDPGDFLNTTQNIVTHQYPNFGVFTVHGRITDKDGASTDYYTTVEIDKVGNGGTIGTHLFVVGADAGGSPEVKVYNDDGSLRFDFQAYDQAFTGGVRVATGDVTGDGVEDIITSPGPGGGPDIRVFDGVTGAMVRDFLAYGPGFSGGVFVASGDVNHDNFDDIVLGAGPGGGPHVLVISGRDNSVLASFYAYSADFTGGVNVATGDVSGDKFADIVTAAGPGGGPHVQVFDATTGAVIRSFYAFESTFTGGVSVAMGDFNGDGIADFITGRGPEPKTDSSVKVFNGADMSVIWDFVPYTNLRTGVRVAAEDVNGDGAADIVIAPAAGTSSHVIVLNGKTLLKLQDFVAFDPAFLGGVYVG